MVFKKDGFSAVWIVFLNTYLKRLKKNRRRKRRKGFVHVICMCIYIYIYICGQNLSTVL